MADQFWFMRMAITTKLRELIGVLLDFFILYQLRRISIGEGLALDKKNYNDKTIKHFQNPHNLERHMPRSCNLNDHISFNLGRGQ